MAFLVNGWSRVEIELKFRLEDPLAVTQRLMTQGFQFHDRLEQLDTYFNAPDRDYARTDEALRIRRTWRQGLSDERSASVPLLLTYKGPKQGERGKVRTELEIPIAEESAEELQRLLIALGFRKTAEVQKQRTVYRLGPERITICLDEVQGLGKYLELETMAESAQLVESLDGLAALARELGLEAEERRSYLEMLLSLRR
jgi:adenylate cyclase class 2